MNIYLKYVSDEKDLKGWTREASEGNFAFADGEGHKAEAVKSLNRWLSLAGREKGRRELISSKE
jgi:hypothetical protein